MYYEVTFIFYGVVTLNLALVAQFALVMLKSWSIKLLSGIPSPQHCLSATLQDPEIQPLAPGEPWGRLWQ